MNENCLKYNNRELISFTTYSVGSSKYGSSSMVCESTVSIIRVGIVGSSLWDSPVSVGILGWSPNVGEIILSPLDSFSDTNDILIDAEVWDDVVSWVDWAFGSSEIGFKVMGHLNLGVFDVVLGVDNLVGFSEVWNEVINWVSGICWSLLNFEWGSVGGKEWFSVDFGVGLE